MSRIYKCYLNKMPAKYACQTRCQRAPFPHLAEASTQVPWVIHQLFRFVLQLLPSSLHLLISDHSATANLVCFCPPLDNHFGVEGFQHIGQQSVHFYILLSPRLEPMTLTLSGPNCSVLQCYSLGELSPTLTLVMATGITAVSQNLKVLSQIHCSEEYMWHMSRLHPDCPSHQQQCYSFSPQKPA